MTDIRETPPGLGLCKNIGVTRAVYEKVRQVQVEEGFRTGRCPALGKAAEILIVLGAVEYYSNAGKPKDLENRVEIDLDRFKKAIHELYETVGVV